MADITNAQAVKFCNETIRPAANDLAQLYYRAKRVTQEWTAQEMSTLIANTDADTVIDGSAEDGRPIIQGDDVHNIVNRCNELISDYEATTNAKLNTVLAVATNAGGTIPEQD